MTVTPFVAVLITAAAAYIVGCVWVIPWAMRSAVTNQTPTGDRGGHVINRAGQFDAAGTGRATEHEISLACIECGSRQIPPVRAMPSPLMPYSDLGLVSLAEAGYVVTATCRECCSPLTSRRMTAAEADQARRFGAVDVDPAATIDELIASL